MSSTLSYVHVEGAQVLLLYRHLGDTNERIVLEPKCHNVTGKKKIAIYMNQSRILTPTVGLTSWHCVFSV